MYCYIGCVICWQRECIASMVVQTKPGSDCNCRHGLSDFRPELPRQLHACSVDGRAHRRGSGYAKAALEDLLTRISNMWAPWAELATRQRQRTLRQLLAQSRKTAPVRQTPTQPTPSEVAAIATPVVHLVALPEGEPDWDCDVDTEVLRACK